VGYKLPIEGPPLLVADAAFVDPNIARLGELMPAMMDLINRRSAGETLQIMSECGLTLPQIVAMHVLRARSGLPLLAVQEILRLSASATSTLIDKLVEKGFVDRRENQADRRQKVLQLTPSGVALLDRMAQSRAQEFTQALALVDPELRAQLVTLFERVIEQLRQGEPSCQPS